MAKSYSTVKDAAIFEKKKSHTLPFSLGIPLAYLCMCVLLSSTFVYSMKNTFLYEKFVVRPIYYHSIISNNLLVTSIIFAAVDN